MNPFNLLRLLVVAVPVAGAAYAQARPLSAAAPRLLSLVADGKIDISKAGGARDLVLSIGPDGRAVLAPRNGWGGNILAFDASGAPLSWKLTTGRNDNADIGLVDRVGWIAGGGSAAGSTFWIGDPMYHEIALVDGQGKVAKSLDYASWIHPHWGERRAYPLFRGMEPLAVYGDTTMLVLPYNERSLISTPTFDRTVLHLVRTTWSGAIERTVATLPLNAAQLPVRTIRGVRTYGVPFAARSFWGVSSDGMRIAVVSSGVSAADSGAVHVTMLNDRGDTVFNRRYPYIAAPVLKEAVDKYLEGIHDAGTVPAQHIRDSIAKQIPAFQSFITSVFVGHDHSTWVILRAASDTTKERRALVLDAKGDVAGLATIPVNVEPAAVSLDHVWAFDLGRLRTPTGITRYAITPTGAPPARSGRASTSSAPSPPPR